MWQRRIGYVAEKAWGCGVAEKVTEKDEDVIEKVWEILQRRMGM